MKQILELGHHTIFQASNGHEALQVVSTAPIDLVITDILMPDRDGLDVIRQLKGTHPGSKCSRILVAGLSSTLMC